MDRRLGYIDALRGITMLLVVFSHVEIFTFGVNYSESLINSFFISFRMPLFFFISGFIAYKKVDWNRTYFVKMLRKKFMVQIIPTLFFCMLFYFVCHSEDLVDYITLNVPPVALSIVPLQKRSLSVRQSYDYF